MDETFKALMTSANQISSNRLSSMIESNDHLEHLEEARLQHRYH